MKFNHPYSFSDEISATQQQIQEIRTAMEATPTYTKEGMIKYKKLESRLIKLTENLKYYQICKKFNINPDLPGHTCAATAFGSYGIKLSGSQTFFANPQKYGFKEISFQEAVPGDIVLANSRKEYKTDVPNHVMLLHTKGLDESKTGGTRFSYSNGGVTQDSLKSGVYYPSPKFGYRYYRYVGTPEELAAEEARKLRELGPMRSIPLNTPPRVINRKVLNVDPQWGI